MVGCSRPHRGHLARHREYDLAALVGTLKPRKLQVSHRVNQVFDESSVIEVEFVLIKF